LLVKPGELLINQESAVKRRIATGWAALSVFLLADLERFFLRRQRAMHAWDLTVFDDFGAVAKNDRLKRYVAGTRKPLRDHAETVVRLANKKGIPGGLTTIQAEAR
jgi:hypothetical protein